MLATKNIVDVKVKEILSKYPGLSLPISIDEIAQEEGLKVMPYPLGEDVSGFLAIEHGQAVIGYNQTESRVRRRFTIAHELGHYFLHREQSSLFVDKMFRAYRTSATTAHPEHQRLEQEANSFAAAILMPTALIKKEIASAKIDFGNEDGMRELAKQFDVSTIAMHYRLTNLGLLW
jgi:Zn-dependent peptidase ImmA (M78 family)